MSGTHPSFTGAYLPLGIQVLVNRRRGQDERYLWWCSKNHNNTQYVAETMARIRVKIPALPDSLYHDVRVANAPHWQARYWSILSADGVIPLPVFDAVDG